MATTPTASAQAPSTAKRLKLNALKADIARVEVVQKDLVITLKSGRKILVPDGVSTASASEQTWLTFANEEQVPLNRLFSEAEVSVGANPPVLWEQISPDMMAASTSSTMGVAAGSAGGLTTLQMTGAALGAMALGGGGGGGGGASGGGTSSSGTNSGGGQSNTNTTYAVQLSAISTDTGASSNDRITSDNTLTFSGTTNAADGTTVQIVLNAGTAQAITLRTTANGGTWQAAHSSALSDGAYTVDVTLLSGSNQVIATATQTTITVITPGSTAPVGVDGTSLADKTIDLTSISPDDGVVTNDFKTSAKSLVFNGTSNAANGTHVVLSIDGALHYTTVTNGVWHLDNTTQSLSAGSHQVQVSLADAAGNLAVSSPVQEVVVLDSALTLLSKTTGAIAQTANLVLLFSDTVLPVAGKYITLVDESTNRVLETMEVTDTNRVTFNGKEVTVNPANNLVIPNTYHALIDSGAFVSSSAMVFGGISGNTDWIFHPVDPATTVTITGTNVDASNGVNASELTQLVVSGTVGSPNMGVVTDLAIGDITFVSTDGLHSVTVAQGNLPTIDPTTHVWTLAHDNAWASQLVSDKTYHVLVQLNSKVSNVATQSVAQSANVLLDTQAPELTQVSANTNSLNIGQTATFTLTFSEDPGDSLSVNDFLVTGGAIGFLSSTGTTRQVVFTPTANQTNANVMAVQLKPNSFTDAVGNVGSVAGAVTWPSLRIDTQAPAVTGVVIGGADGATNADKAGTLNVNDKVRATVTLSEVVSLNGTPTFTVDVGGLNKTLRYVSGSGSNTLVFEYTIAAGDLDNVGGLTASANALLLNGGHLTDAAGNHADIATPAIFSNANSLVVDGGASDATRRAAQLIQTFAENNNDPQQIVGTAPTLQDYLDAGINSNSLTADNVALINNVLAGANVGGTEVDTQAELQVLVNAYSTLLSLSDGNDNTPTANTPGFATYGVLGITGVTDNTHARLLGDVLDTKNRTDVDGIYKLQALADAESAVLDAAKGVSGLTAAQLRLLGLPNVTDDNFPALLRAIGNTADNGSGVDTLSELQSEVATAVTRAANAITTVQDFAELNTDSLPVGVGGYVGTPPTLQHFVDAGVSGATNNNRLALVDALATLSVTGNEVNTTTKVQALVDAYVAILRLADGFGNTASNATPSAAQYTRIGVTGLDATQAATANKVALLGDVIDRKQLADVDTVKEIQTLADDVSTLLATAAGGNSLTLQQLTRLGITNVSAGTLADVVAAIQATADDGSGVNSYALLTGVITDRLLLIQQALGVISTYAQNNTQPDGPVTGTAPTRDDYANAGVTGVTVGNLSAINNALTTLSVNEASVNTTVEVQALVDAYRVLIASANGQVNTDSLRLTPQQYNLLGLTGLDPNSSTSTVRANLLGDVIDRKVFADIDTVGELQSLLDAVIAVMNAANGVNGLTIAQLEKLGITGVTTDNQTVVLRALAQTADDGSDVDRLDDLQSLVTRTVNTADAALQVIQNYAQGNADASQSLGTAPSLQDYVDAGIQGVSADNLASINTALATSAVNAARVGSISDVQSVVNAYLQVFAAADGLDNITTASNMRTAYASLGIQGVDSDVEYSLLGDVIDVKNSVDVNTTVKLQNLANAVDAVVRAAAGGQDLTQAQLESLNITGLTADNFPLVLRALNNVPTSGARYSTLVDLQSLASGVVSAARAALTVIQNYADSNSASAPATPSGIHPTRTTYSDAGVSDVTDNNLASINDALATSAVFSNNVNTSVKVQTLVDAYKTILQMADGVSGNATQQVHMADLTTIGVDTSALQSAANTSQRLSLLNNLLDAQSTTGVDSVHEVDQLIRIVNAIQDQAAGITPSYTLTAADFATIGLQGVSSSNLAAWMTAIAATANDGSEVNTQSKLQQRFYDSLNLTLSGISSDTGISTTDFITNDNTLRFAGTSSAQDGTTVKLTLTPSVGGAITFTTTVSNGAWQATYATALSDGVYSITTQLLDANQTVIRTANARTLSVDTSDSLLANGNNDTDIAGQTIAFTAISPDTGFSNSDFKTSSQLLVFSGTSTAADGAHVAVNIDGVTYYTTVSNGAWRYDSTGNTPLVSGLHKVQAQLIDAAGNVAASSVMRDVVIDDTALTIVARTTGAIAQTANLVLTFSDNVVAQNSKYISIWDSSTRAIYETIETTDARISIVGKTVTINPANDLVLGKNYYATIDRDAFVSSTGVTFKGLTNITEWTFNPVDPSTTVVFAGAGVTPNDGINASELSNLTVTGTVSSTNGLLVTNLEITRLIFTPTDGSAGFTLTTGMPVVDTNTRIWTLANDNSWTSRLVSGKSYTVSAQLEADIGNTHGVSVADSLSSLIDTAAPTLVITTNAASLKIGQTATLTFTFSEIPAGFTQADIVIPTSGGNPIGSISNFSATEDPKVFTALFTPAANMALTSSLASVVRTTYTDVVGNTGSQDAASPTVVIDTQAPNVTAIALSGVDSSLSAKVGDLLVGDKIKVTLTMNEATTVDTSGGTPTFDIVVGSSTKTAVYTSGSGTNALVFYATVALGDTDNAGGITHLANTLALNGAKLRDAAGNDAVLSTAATNAGTNTLVVETNALALSALASAAQNNTASGVNTPVSVYTRAGVVGVTAGNLGAVNSTLNAAAVTGTEADTLSEVQALVDAYKAVLALADSGVVVGTPVTAAQIALLGVTGVNTLTLGAIDVPTTTKASLLSSVIDAKASTAVDTVGELQTLADSVQAVMLAVNGVVSGGSALTKAQLDGLGITGVTDNNLADALAALANTPNDGSSVNTLPALQYVVNLGVDSSKQSALTLISNFAADNTTSQPITGAFSYVGTLPTLRDYANAGAINIDNTNLDAINDALATNDVGRTAVQDTAGIQAVISAYNALLALSDGVANAGTPLTATQLGKLGVNLGNARTVSSNLALLNQVLDRQAGTSVDRVAEIDALVSIVNAIQDSVGNLSASSGLTAANLTTIGLTLANNSHLAGVRESMAAQSAGSNIDSLSKLQALIDFYEAAPLSIGLTTDSGQSNSDTISNNIALTFGAAGAGNTLQYKVDGGSFSATYTAPTTQGAHTVLLRQVSSQGYLGPSASLTFTYDSTAPATWDINTVTAGTNSSETSAFNSTHVAAGKTIAANMGLAAETDIASVVVTVGGAQVDSVNDKLVFGTITQAIDGGSQSGNNQTINTVTGVNWVYNNKVLTLSKNGGGAWSATDLQKIEQGLKFKTASNATQGDRTFSFAHTDLAGNTGVSVVETVKVDTTIGAVDLINGGAVNNTASSYFGINDIAAGKVIAPNMGLPADTDLAKIMVTMGGANADTSNDKLLFGTITQTLNGLNANGQGQTIGGVSGISWDYSPAGFANTLLLSKSDGSAFSAAEVQAIEKALKFQTSLGTTQGARTFAFAHMDVAGNTSASATQTVSVDTVAPVNVDLDTTAGVQSAQTSYYILSQATANTLVTVAPNMAAPVETDIATITIGLSGAIDIVNDQLSVNSVNAGDGTITIGVVTGILQTYDNVNHVLSFTKNGGGSFTTSEVQTIERAVQFRTSSSASQGGRNFVFSHIDVAGNTSTNTATQTILVDFSGPSLDLNTSSNTSTDWAITTLATQAAINSPTALSEATATVTDISNIASLQIRVRGLRDGTNERLMVNASDINATWAATTGSVTVSGTAWNWSYATSTGIFTFSLTSATATTAQVATLIQSLGYRNVLGNTATDGVRQFMLSATDAAGYTGAEVVSSMGVNAHPAQPSLAASNAMTPLDANNDGAKGDQFVIHFSEDVRVADVTTVSNWTLNNAKTLGTGATITAIDTIWVGNTAYASNYLVKSGTSPTYTLTNQALSLNASAVTTKDQYADLPDVTLSGYFMLEAWVYLDSFPVDTTGGLGKDYLPRILDISQGQDLRNLRLGYSSTGGLFFDYFDRNSMNSFGFRNGSLSLSTWTHIAVGVSANGSYGKIQLYLNGTLVQEAQLTLYDWSTEFNNITLTQVLVGKSIWNDGFLKGAVKDVRIYDDTRTAAEIAGDMKGQVDITDPDLKAYYAFNGDVKSGIGAADATLMGTTIPTYRTDNGNTMTIASGNVVDVSGQTAATNQVLTLLSTNSSRSGNRANNTLTGDADNNFLAGYGGDDTLSGGLGADTFAWLLGDKGSDTVSDFKVAEGDMIDLSGILKNNTDTLGPNSSSATLGKYLQLTQSGNNAVLKIDVDGTSNFVGGLDKTITFTNGWLNGLNDTLTNLASKKILNLNYQTATPLVLDLNGDGVHTTPLSAGVVFDFDGQGRTVQTGWTDGIDGLLVLDRNQDGVINNGSELFGSSTALPDGNPAPNGFEALRPFDTNQDNVIDALDDVFTHLQVWIDANVDGISTPQELHSLASLGVQSIHLNATSGNAIDNDNALALNSQWTDTNGQKHALVDVVFNTHVVL